MVAHKKLFLFLLKISIATAFLALSLPITPSDGKARAGQSPVSSAALSADQLKARQSEPAGQQHGRRVRVGLYENKPKLFTDANGRPAGIFIDILTEIARKEKWQLEYVSCSWPECLPSLKAGRIDLMPDVALTPEREKDLAFNEEPVLESWSQIYAHDATVNKLSDLNGRRLALLNGSIQQTVLRQMMNGFGYQVSFVQTDSYEEAFKLVAQGKVDAAVTNHLFGNYYYQEFGLVKTSIVFNPVSLFFATARGRNPDLLKTISADLRSLKGQSGSVYYRTMEHWMERPPQVVVPRYLFWIIGSIGASLALAFVVIALLRGQVRARTRHLAQANATLRQSEEKYRNLFETMAQGVIYQNAEGIIVSANPAAERILGLSLAELMGSGSLTPQQRAIHEDGSPFTEEEQPAMVALNTGTDVMGVVMGIYHPLLAETRWIEVDATPDFTPGERKPSQVYTMFADITDRRQAEETLRNRHRELEQIFTTLPDALIYADSEQRIVRVNPAFVKIFGYEPDAVIGRKTALLYAQPEDPGLTSHEPHEADYRRANGEIFTGETVGAPIHDSKGALMGMFGLVRDITERRRLESQLQQAQKMESVGRLAGGVAHDFNNLLTIILGYGEMVLKDLAADHAHHESLEQIVQAGVRARDLTRQLLAFSRKQVLETHPVDVNHVVADFKRLLGRVIGEDITLELTLSNEPCRIVADSGQLEQVFMNLAVNARDAMPDGGTLTIETSLTELDENYAAHKPAVIPGTYVMIGISDTGSGMDRETQKNIFEPFFTTKGKDKGTGLGLATSYGIIKQHGGSIWVYSEPGRGTTFKIYLPLCPGNLTSQQRESADPVKVEGRETVLLVEDNDQVRKLAETLLKQMGYTVLAAEGGAAALAMLDSLSGPLHLLLTDVVMPEMNGRELFDRLSVRFPQLRVIYMSGYTDDLILHRGVLEQGVHFIQKPFSTRNLIARVRAVLDEGE